MRGCLVHLLPGLNLHRTEPVLIQVVGVDPLNAQRCIAITTPASAEIELVVNTAYAITAGEIKPQGVVLSIRCIGELHLTEQRSEKSPGSTKTIDAESVVRTILIGPFTVVYQTGGKSFQVEVAHPITANYHSGFLTVKRVNDGLQYLR